MPIDVDTSEAPGFVRITLRGAWPTIDEQRAVRQHAIGAGQLTEETRALIDLRAVTSTAPYTDVARIIAAAMQDQGWPLYRAYLVGSAVQVGLVSQMKALAPSHVEIEVFTDDGAAMQWLRRDRRP